ncbi:MAG: cyanophycinase [Thermoguttaceae bacterium]
MVCPALAGIAAGPPSGTCVIIGGALRSDNAPIFHRLIEMAGGAEQCRFVVLSSASHNVRGAQRFADILTSYGPAARQIAILDIRPENAAQTAFDPANVAQIRRSTAAYFVGGDQERITQALRKADGTETPVLAALEELLARGGVIAGSSAGAAVQSRLMIRAAGLPDGGLDEGMDTLDFGLTRDPRHRGLLVTAGLGFFRGGVVDQHFNQTRGRLGRLARVTAEQKIRFGFGIDENTAMIVEPRGEIEVVGTGCVTVVDAAGATCDDGPLGCRIFGLQISCLQTGDRFDLKTCMLKPNPAKELTAEGEEWKAGNHLITDISAPGTLPYALFCGLSNNTSVKQIGIALHYTRSFGHGYRFTFRKLKTTRVWEGHVDNVAGRAVQDIALDIEPIVSTLQPPATALPDDLPAVTAATACRALWFRGILLADEQRHFHPDATLTRADFAMALAQAIQLNQPEGDVNLADVPESSPYYDAVAEVVHAELLKIDSRGLLHPEATVSRQEAAYALVRAWELDRGRKLPAEPVVLADDSDVATAYRGVIYAAIRAGWMPLEAGRFRPTKPIVRRDAASALDRLIGLPW